MDIPVSNTLEHNHSVCADITNNKGRRVSPNRNDAADSVSSHSPSQSVKSHAALNHRVVHEIPMNAFTSAQMPPVDRRVVHEIPINGFHASEMLEVFYTPNNRREAMHSDIPKCIRFNGKMKLSTFLMKYDQYACMCNWLQQDKADNLIWCLEGIAADFYVRILKKNPRISFGDLVAKFENWFEFTELVGTSILLFNTARQNEKESLEQWADRACDLAVIKFCSGLCDRDLAKLVTYNPQNPWKKR